MLANLLDNTVVQILGMAVIACFIGDLGCGLMSRHLFATEFTHFEGAQERRDAVERAKRAPRRRLWWRLLRRCLVIVPAALVAYEVAQLIGRTVSIPDRYLEVVCMGVVFGATAWGELWVAARRIRLNLRRRLNDQGAVVCMRCGYDLRGQVERRCPECGEPFECPGEDGSGQDR